jgi:hypothetical protein
MNEREIRRTDVGPVGDHEGPSEVKSRPWHSIAGIVLPFVGVVLPLCLLVGGYRFVKHDRVVVTDEEITLVLLCSLLFLTLELAALVFGLAARRTVLGKAAVGLSGVLLTLATFSFAYVLTIRLDRRNAGWLEGTPFWVIVMGVLLVISVVIFALFRAKWLSDRR